jgi:hypothetical protein
MIKRIKRKHNDTARKPVEKLAPPVGLERAFTVNEIAQTGVASRAKLYVDIRAGRLRAINCKRRQQ